MNFKVIYFYSDEKKAAYSGKGTGICIVSTRALLIRVSGFRKVQGRGEKGEIN